MKKSFIALLAILGIFSILAGPFEATAYQPIAPQCITGGPANTLTFRIIGSVPITSQPFAAGTNGSFVVGTFHYGNIVTAPINHQVSNGRRFVSGTLGRSGWVPTGAMTLVNTCN